MQRFMEWIIRHRRAVLVLSALVTLGLAANLKFLHVVIDPDDVLPRNHPFVHVTQQVESIFGNKFTGVIGITAKNGDVFQPAVLEKIKAITAALYTTPGVVRVNISSLAARKSKDIRGDNEGLTVTPLMDAVPRTPAALAALRAAYRNNPAYENTAVSLDGRTASIVFEVRKDPKGFQAIDARIRNIVDPLRDGSVEIMVSGTPVYIAMFERYSERMAFLFPLAVLMIGLIHYEAFRTFQGLILPLVTALLAVVWSMGLMSAFQVPLDAFNAITPILILAIAAGHAVQILKRYYEEYGALIAGGKLSRAEANRQAVVQSMTRIGPVMLAAGLIGAASFMSLLVFDIRSIRTFGVFTGLGILSALAVELTFIPALRATLKAPSDRHIHREKAGTFWDRIVDGFAGLMAPRRRVWMFAAAGVFTAVMVVAAFRVQVRNSTRDYISPTNPIRLDDTKLNDRMAGTNALYVLVEGKQDDAIKDPAVLRGIEQTQRFLEQDPLVGKTLSIADFIKRINKAMHGEDPKFDTIPDDRNLISQYLLLYSISGEPGDFDSSVDYGYRNAVIQAFMKSDNTVLVDRVVARVQPYVAQHFPDSVAVTVGGGATNGAAVDEVMVHGKIRNIIQIAAVVFVVSALLFRSLPSGLLVLVPLVMTVVTTFGVMGLTGIPLNTGTALVSALAVGIGADYAIYFTYRLREELRHRGDEADAIHRTFRSAGKATLFVATAVAGGYLLLITSVGFNLHVWLGILVSLAMVVSAVSALTLYPGLLLMLRPRFVFEARPAESAKMPGGAVGVGIAAALVLLAGHEALAANLTPVQIMERNYLVSRFDDSASGAKFTLINDSGQERVRETFGRSKLLPNGVDNMRMTRFTSPPDVKGTVSLLIEHSEKDDDIWIYLPALKKVRRLVSSNKKDSFVGTDFSYGDVIGHKVADWKQVLLREEPVDGQPCYVIQSTPVSAQVQSDSGYSKRIEWIRKDNFVSIKGEFYDEAGQLLKLFAASDVRLLDPGKGRWQPLRLEARNVQTGHRTVIEFTHLKVNQGVGSEFFTTRYMEREG